MNHKQRCFSCTPRDAPHYEGSRALPRFELPSIPQTIKVALASQVAQRTARLPHLHPTAASLVLGRCHGTAGTAGTEHVHRHALGGSQLFRASLFRTSHGVCNASWYAWSSRRRNRVAPLPPASLCSSSPRDLCRRRLRGQSSSSLHAVARGRGLTLLRTAPPGACHPFLAVSARG
jgi:hypothetical protein